MPERVNGRASGMAETGMCDRKPTGPLVHLSPMDHELDAKIEPPMNMRALLSKVPARPAEFFSFIAIGMLNTCFGYCIYAIVIFMGYQPALALLIGNSLGIAFNFLTFGKVVFKNFDWKRAPHFLVIYGINYFANVWMLSAVQHYIPSPYVAYLIVLPISVTFLYYSLRRFAFGSRV
jgi:putative flippase GtrA